MKQFQMSSQSRRKRSTSAADITGNLPIYNPASAIGRRASQSWNSRPEMTYKLIHLIPVVVIVCFFILWCFSSPVELETKDGRTTFVPRAKNKKSQQTNESTDLDLTVLALENPPVGFLSVSDGPYASLAHPNQPNVSLLDSFDHSASSTDSRVQNASLSVPNELKAPFSDFNESNELFVDLHEPNASFSVPDDVKLLFPVSDEPRLSYPDKSNKIAPQTSGKGMDELRMLILRSMKFHNEMFRATYDMHERSIRLLNQPISGEVITSVLKHKLRSIITNIVEGNYV